MESFETMPANRENLLINQSAYVRLAYNCGEGSHFLFTGFEEIKMLTSVEGIYRNGHIELKESPTDVPEGTWVIVTFVKSSDIDLKSQGIDREQADALRASLSTFADDWDSPEMRIYDNYDAAKANI